MGKIKPISLTCDTISHDEIDSLCDWLKTYPKLTKGKLTRQLEEDFSEAVECFDCVFVNSGSSANLLMFAALLELGKLKVGDKVGVPGLCWSTDIAPIIQLGLIPVILDVNLDNLGIDITYLPGIIEEYDIKCIISVSVLGIPGYMKELVDICNKYNIILLEDNCESLGSKYDGNSLGTFGVMSSWSTFFSHHISTIEGGFVTCGTRDLWNVLASIRSHGWYRDIETYNASNYYEQIEKQKERFDFPYRFYNLGFNLRNTEIGAFLGISQLKKLDDIISTREKNFAYFCTKMCDIYNNKKIDIPQLYNQPKENVVSSFAFPVISENRSSIIEKLKSNNIECRPLIAGNISKHPVIEKNKYRIIRTMDRNLRLINSDGFYLPNHTGISYPDIDLMIDTIKDLI